MAVYKRGGVWWYKFKWNSKPIRKSTKQSNKRVAEQMEAAHKTALAKGEVGIREKKPTPTLADFAPKFTAAIETTCAEKPQTVKFYKAKLKTLVGKLGRKRLEEIQEAEIEQYTQERARQTSRRKRTLSPASVNRELATLVDCCALPMSGRFWIASPEFIFCAANMNASSRSITSRRSFT